jgi:hypothetical protein
MMHGTVIRVIYSMLSTSNMCFWSYTRVCFLPFGTHVDRLIYLQGKQGVVKHLYMGILFIYNESESENCGFFCAQSGSCENVKKRKESSTSENLVRIYMHPLVNQLEMFIVSFCFRCIRTIQSPCFLSLLMCIKSIGTVSVYRFLLYCYLSACLLF